MENLSKDLENVFGDLSHVLSDFNLGKSDYPRDVMDRAHQRVQAAKETVRKAQKKVSASTNDIPETQEQTETESFEEVEPKYSLDYRGHSIQDYIRTLEGKNKDLQEENRKLQKTSKVIDRILLGIFVGFGAVGLVWLLIFLISIL